MALHPPRPSDAEVYYARAMRTRFPLMVWWGVFNCRHIDSDPSKGWSQHAWANAADYHPPTKAYGDRVYAYFNARREQYSIAHLLWQVPFHYDHIHADFTPQGTGTPPCAGGKLSSGGGLSTSAQALKTVEATKHVGLTAHQRKCLDIWNGLSTDQRLSDPRFQKGGTCYDIVDKGFFEGISAGITDIVDALKVLIDVFGFFADPHNWFRFAEILGGSLLVIGGLILIVRDVRS